MLPWCKAFCGPLFTVQFIHSQLLQFKLEMDELDSEEWLTEGLAPVQQERGLLNTHALFKQPHLSGVMPPEYVHFWLSRVNRSRQLSMKVQIAAVRNVGE